MRSLKILLAFGALGGTLYMLDQATRPMESSMDRVAAAAGLGLAEMIEARAGLTVSGIVTTPGDGDISDFRGLLETDGRLRPVYGQVRACSVGGDADCREIAYLEIDGKPATAAIATVAAATPDDPADDVIVTADIWVPEGDAKAGPAIPAPTEIGTVHDASGMTLADPGTDTEKRVDAEPVANPATTVPAALFPIPEPRPALAMLDTDEPRKPPVEETDGQDRAPTHAVDGPVIDARNGPGEGSPVVARLASGLRLAKIGEQDGWGRFIVLDGEATGREVWAALGILKSLN